MRTGAQHTGTLGGSIAVEEREDGWMRTGAQHTGACLTYDERGTWSRA